MALLGRTSQSIGIQITTEADTKGSEQATASLQRLEDQSTGSSKAMSILTSAAKVTALAVAAVGAAGLVAGKSFVSSAADFEQTRIGLENMLGSADAARKMLAQVSKFAADTPFEFPELAQATKQLIAFGFSGDDAFKTMKQLGDVSAAIGAPIGDLSYLMGTLRAQGRAFTIDIRQFAQRGIPIYEYLSKVLKVNTTDLNGLIESGKVGFPEVQKAFEMMTAEGGKFHGTMEKQSKSLSGLFSTLKDNIGLAGRELVGISQEGDVKTGSLFDRLRTTAAGLNEQLGKIDWSSVSQRGMTAFSEFAVQVQAVASEVGDYLQPKLEALWSTITSRFAPAVSQFAQAIGPEAGVGLVWAFGMAIDAINGLMAVAAPMLEFLGDHTWIVWGIVGAFVAFRASLAIQGAIAAFQVGMAIMGGEALTATGIVTGLRVAIAALAGPWQIVLAIVGVAAVLAGLQTVSDKLDQLFNKWADKGSKIGLGGNQNIQVDKASGLGLVDQLRRAFGGRATGGPVAGGVPYLVGENADGSPNNTTELFVPSQSGTIMNARDTQKMLKGGSGMGEVNITQNIYNQVDYNKGIAELGFRLATR